MGSALTPNGAEENKDVYFVEETKRFKNNSSDTPDSLTKTSIQIILPTKCASLFALGRGTLHPTKGFMDARLFPHSAERDTRPSSSRLAHGMVGTDKSHLSSGVVNLNFHLPKQELMNFLREFMDDHIVAHHMQYGISVDDIYTRRFLFFAAKSGDDASAFASNRLVQLLLSTNDVRYLKDIYRKLLEPIKKTMRKAFTSISEFVKPLKKLPPNPERHSGMADSVRKLYENTDLGYGEGRRISDRVHHISQAIINHDFGRIIQAELIANDNFYNMGFDNVPYQLHGSSQQPDFSEIGLGGRIDDFPEGTLLHMRDKFRRILPNDCPIDPNSLQKKHVAAIVDAYVKSVTYRLSATRMWNNHGCDSLAIMDMDDWFIDRFVQELNPDIFDENDAALIDAFLRHEPNRFRMCSVEYKTSSSNTFKSTFFYDHHGKGDFSSYPDELVNTAAQINSVLRKYGIPDQLPVVSMFHVTQGQNWNPNVILDFSDLSFYEGGYHRILECETPVKAIRSRLGYLLKEIIQNSGLTEAKQKQLIHEIISEIILPHMRIRQAYCDASVVEEFFLTGEQFMFNPARIGFGNRRDGHVLIYPINASNPPKVPVIIDSSKRTEILLHPHARNFRMENGHLVFGFDIADEVNPDDNPFKLSENEILESFVIEEIDGLRKGSLMDYLESIMHYGRAGAKSKPLTNEDINDIISIKTLVDKIIGNQKGKTELITFLLERQPPHLKNHFSQIILDRLLKNTNPSGLASLFINGKHMRLFKIIEAWGSEYFLKQISEYTKIPTVSPVRYDEIIITAKEPLPYASKSKSKPIQAKMPKRFKNAMNEIQSLLKNRSTIKKLEDLVDAIMNANIAIAKRLVVLPDNERNIVPILANPLPRTPLDLGGYLNNVPLRNLENFRTVMSMIWRNRNYCFINGADFLRFPITAINEPVKTIGSQFFAMRLGKTLLEPNYDCMKKIWKNLHLYYRFGDGNSRPIAEFNKFLWEIFNSNGVSDENFQCLAEFARFGVVKTRFSYTFGILNDYLDKNSLETIDQIAQRHAISWETIILHEAGGRNTQKTKIGKIYRNGRNIEINDKNRIVWYIDAILSDNFDRSKEPILKFKQTTNILTRVAILTGLPLEKVQNGFKITEARFFRNGLNTQDIKFLRNVPDQVNALFVDMFIKNHTIDQKAYHDIMQIINQNLRGRYQNPYSMDKIMKDTEPSFRKLQIKILATFFTPPGVWFAPSGRIGAKNTINIRNDSPIAIHFVDPETVAIANLNEQVNFIQDTLRQTIDFFKKIANQKQNPSTST